MDKIKSLEELEIICEKKRTKGKTIGLITGCFDILHIGHISLFENAKKQTDTLIVGVENDATIKLSKGTNRPLNNQTNRLHMLNSIIYIDYIFINRNTFDYADSKKANDIHDYIVTKIKPHFIFTNKKKDKYWDNKKTRTMKYGIKLISTGENLDSSSRIFNKIISEL